VRRDTWDVPGVFGALASAGEVPDEESFRAFNMGVGMMVILPEADAGGVVAAARDAVVDAWIAGEVVNGHGTVRLLPRGA
jgi:phosphoribosylformylglycinamidine cyclo-ligase